MFQYGNKLIMLNQLLVLKQIIRKKDDFIDWRDKLMNDGWNDEWNDK